MGYNQFSLDLLRPSTTRLRVMLLAWPTLSQGNLNMGKQWCVYAASATNADGETYAYGDGYKKSTRRLYGLADTREDSEAMLAEFKRGPLLTETRIPGNRQVYPMLEVREYDPLDFVSDQSREAGGYSDAQISALRERLAADAEENAKTLRGD